MIEIQVKLKSQRWRKKKTNKKKQKQKHLEEYETLKTMNIHGPICSRMFYINRNPNGLQGFSQDHDQKQMKVHSVDEAELV